MRALQLFERIAHQVEEIVVGRQDAPFQIEFDQGKGAIDGRQATGAVGAGVLFFGNVDGIGQDRNQPVPVHGRHKDFAQPNILSGRIAVFAHQQVMLSGGETRPIGRRVRRPIRAMPKRGKRSADQLIQLGANTVREAFVGRQNETVRAVLANGQRMVDRFETMGQQGHIAFAAATAHAKEMDLTAPSVRKFPFNTEYILTA